MTSLINRVLKENTSEYINSNPQVQQIKSEIKSELSIEPDKIEVCEENKKPKKYGKIIGGIVAIGGLIGTIASVAVMIGRNPAKAAKILKGNTKIVNQAYEEGNKLAEKILNGADTKVLENFMSVFKKPEYRSKFSEDIAELEKRLMEKNITPNPELSSSIKSLKENLQTFYTKLEQDLLHGKDIYENKLIEQFVRENEQYINNIRYHIQEDINFFDLKYRFSGTSAEFGASLRHHVKDCPKEVLPNDGIFYHGTSHAGKIYKNGFTPFVSNQLGQSSREMGAGIYISPDSRVAAAFSGLFGNIIPLKLANNAKIAIVDESTHRLFYDALAKFSYKELTKYYTEAELKSMPKETINAMVECMFRNVFKKAGYDAAYIPKAVKGGGLFNIQALFAPNVNELIGANQRQVIVFSPEKLEIVSRSFTERVGDLKDKFSAFKAMFMYSFKNPSLF